MLGIVKAMTTWSAWLRLANTGVAQLRVGGVSCSCWCSASSWVAQPAACWDDQPGAARMAVAAIAAGAGKLTILMVIGWIAVYGIRLPAPGGNFGALMNRKARPAAAAPARCSRVKFAC